MHFLWRVSVAMRPERRQKQARVFEYFVVAETAAAAKALGFASRFDRDAAARENVLRVTVDNWGIAGPGDIYLSDNLKALPESIPTEAQIAEATALRGNA